MQSDTSDYILGRYIRLYSRENMICSRENMIRSTFCLSKDAKINAGDRLAVTSC